MIVLLSDIINALEQIKEKHGDKEFGFMEMYGENGVIGISLKDGEDLAEIDIELKE